MSSALSVGSIRGVAARAGFGFGITIKGSGNPGGRGERSRRGAGFGAGQSLRLAAVIAEHRLRLVCALTAPWCKTGEGGGPDCALRPG